MGGPVFIMFLNLTNKMIRSILLLAQAGDWVGEENGERGAHPSPRVVLMAICPPLSDLCRDLVASEVLLMT